MTLNLFPSRTIALYLARIFTQRILATLLMLVLVLQLLDLLGETGKILSVRGNGEGQVWLYVSLRFPQLIQQFLPYSVLLATLFTFFPLNQNSEVIAMRAAGLSAHQILSPLIATALVVACASFAFNERIVTHASARLNAWKAVNYGAVPPDSDVRANVFVADGPNILFAATALGNGPAMRMDDVTWYVRDADGMVTEQWRSPHATFAAPGWRLDAPLRFTVATTASARLGPTVVARGVSPRQVEIAGVDGDGESVFRLADDIATLRAGHRRTAELEGQWWHKFAKPLSAVLMPLLGGVAAFGLARSGQLFMRLVVGFALGFAYFVVDNAALSIGNFGAYPPLVAAWAPFLLFWAIGETVLVRTEE